MGLCSGSLELLLALERLRKFCARWQGGMIFIFFIFLIWCQMGLILFLISLVLSFLTCKMQASIVLFRADMVIK